MNHPMRPVIFFSKTGCLLPFLIISNLLFGWMFFKTGQWLLIGLVLVLLFILSSIIMAKKIFSDSLGRGRGNAIDVEAEVLDTKVKLPNN